MTGDLFAPASPAAPVAPAPPPPSAEAADWTAFNAAMSALPRVEARQGPGGAALCPHCDRPVDPRKPFAAVGGYEYRDDEAGGGRLRRPAPVLLPLACQAAWWSGRCAATRSVMAGAAP